ncbi:MAG: TlpA disulfide reductase family protein [Acidobacteriota bacterium]
MPLPPGSSAIGFRLPLLCGGEVDLHQWLRDGPVLLAFFKTTCPTCMLAFPFLERIHRHGNALRLLAISQDAPPATMRFCTEFGITIDTALDAASSGYSASNAYAITHVPSLFLISAAGLVEWSSTGFSKPDFEELGRTANAEVFTAHDRVPVWKPG